ncbi:hypothetical protein THAOC_09823, partial [Thalassiosira oceanica]
QTRADKQINQALANAASNKQGHKLVWDRGLQCGKSTPHYRGADGLLQPKVSKQKAEPILGVWHKNTDGDKPPRPPILDSTGSPATHQYPGQKLPVVARAVGAMGPLLAGRKLPQCGLSLSFFNSIVA